MKSYISLALILLLFQTSRAQPVAVGAEGKAIETVFENAARENKFSGVFLASVNGKPVFYGARGFRTFRDQVPLQATDIFELASVSKQFTAMIIMMLQEQGKLQYDDPVEKYLKIPYKGISIRNLLNHTSGLPDYQDIMDKHWDKTKVAGNDDCIAYLNTYAPPALFEPGSQYTYSNTGYLLLASIAEKVSGKDFIELCRERIFRPLGMGSTDIRTNAQKAVTSQFAIGHVEVDGRYVRADTFPSADYTIWLGNRKGPGRISSTAADLLRWDQALYGSSLVSQKTLAQAFTPATLTNGSSSMYGFGWMIMAGKEGPYMVLHTGDNPGYHTQIRRYLKQRVTLILLNNNNSEAMDEILDAAESILIRK